MTVNIALIGTGNWGKNHARIVTQILDSNLSVIVDSLPNKTKELEKIYKVKTSTDYKTIINDDSIDAVVIATPNSTHYKIGKEMLSAGKHTFIEKPLCLTSKEAQKLVDLAKVESSCLMVGHIFTFNPVVQKMKELVDERIFGDIRSIVCTRLGLFPPRPDSGIIIDLAIHDIDIITFLFDRQLPERIFASGKSYIRKKFEELAFITMEYPGNIIAHINVSWLTPAKIRNVWLSGSKKTAYSDLMEQSLEIFEDRIDKKVVSNKANEIIFELVKKRGMSYKPYIHHKEPLMAEVKHFINCIKNGEKPLTSGDVALKTILVAEAAIESIKQKKVIEMAEFIEKRQIVLPDGG